MKYRLIKLVDSCGLRPLIAPFYYGYQKRRKDALYRSHVNSVLSLEQSHEWLRTRLRSGLPLAAGKIGSLEAEALHCFLHSSDPTRDRAWGELKTRLFANVGVFPPEGKTFARFCEVFGASLAEMDGLAVWFNKGEQEAIQKWAPRAQQLEFSVLEPYTEDPAWTMELPEKNVVVVSPFKHSIEMQWSRIQEVWSRRPIWPSNTGSLSVVQAPFSAALCEPRDKDWFDALDRLTDELAATDFDIAFIGAGGYSLPLCARVKQMGRQAIHTGGATQIIFGVMGKRWRGSDFERDFANKSWISPLPMEMPEARGKVEGGCYW